MSLAFDLENNLIDLRSARIFSQENRAWEELDAIPAELAQVSETDAVTRLQQQGGRCRVPVGILGGRKASEEQFADALELGTLITQMGLTLICGGRQGVMEGACKGAAEAGGICVGLLPDENPGTANPYVTIPLATGIGLARNSKSDVIWLSLVWLFILAMFHNGRSTFRIVGGLKKVG